MTKLGPVETLARLALQSDRYQRDMDFRDAVDAVLMIPLYDAAPDMFDALKAIADQHYDEDGVVDVYSASTIVGTDQNGRKQLKGSYIARLEAARAALIKAETRQ